MKKIIFTSNAPEPIGPYSQAVLTNDILYISGQIAIDPNTQTYVPQGIEEETTLVMKNLESILKAADMSFADVIKTSIFLADMNDFATVNAIYSTYFTKDFPARETVEVSVLPQNSKVEISMVAITSQK